MRRDVTVTALYGSTEIFSSSPSASINRSPRSVSERQHSMVVDPLSRVNRHKYTIGPCSAFRPSSAVPKVDRIQYLLVAEIRVIIRPRSSLNAGVIAHLRRHRQVNMSYQVRSVHGHGDCMLPLSGAPSYAEGRTGSRRQAAALF